MNQTGTERLALLLPDLGGGGAERVALAMMKGFLQRGYEVDLVLANRRGLLLPLIPSGVTVVDLEAPRLRQVPLPLARYLRQRRPDALHVMMWPLPVAAVIARAIAGGRTRLVIGEHTTLSATPHALRHGAVRAITRRAYLRADALVTVSTGAADDMAAFLGLPRERVSVLYNPLLLPTELPAPDRMRNLWPAGTRRLLAVGELKAEKNYSLLFRALARLREHIPVSLLILGEGALLDSLTAQVTALGLQEVVVFAGFDTEVWPYYTAAELFVLSSSSEGLPTVLIEALHAGLPIVSTDCPNGPREILDGGRFGTLVPCDDAAALADAMAAKLLAVADPVGQRRRAVEMAGSSAIDRHITLMTGDEATKGGRS